MLLALNFAAANHDNSHSQQQKLEKIRSDINQLNREIAASNKNKQQVFAKLQSAERELAQQNKKLTANQHEITALNQQLKQASQQLKTEEKNLTTVLQDMAKSLRAAYILGSQSELKMLLNQQNPADTSRLYTYLEYLNQAREQKLDKARTLIASLQKKREQISQLQQQLSRQQQALSQHQQQVSATLAKRKQILATLNKQLKSKTARLAHLQQNRANIEKLLDKIKASRAKHDQSASLEVLPTQSFAKLRGQLKPPIQGQVLHNFGERRAEVTLKWRGILFAAQEGQKVHAIAAGRVTFADYFSGFGLLILLDHGDGYLSLYAYNSELSRQMGEWVQAGDVLALAGSSGGQNRTALYFELRHQSRPIDPRPWLGL